MMDGNSCSWAEKGFFFSMDLMIACLMLSLFLLVLLSTARVYSNSAAGHVRETEKEFLGAAISESLVKNRNEADPNIGAAYFNSDKKRVEQNVLDEQLMRKTHEAVLGQYALRAIYEKNGYGKSFFFQSSGDGCLSFERFALLKSPGRINLDKIVIGVVVCDN